LSLPRRSLSSGSTRYNGRRVLLAMLIGMLLGLAIALFLNTIIANTPVKVESENFHWLYRIAAAAGALAGFTIESMRQLQINSPDPAYHHKPSLSRTYRQPEGPSPVDQNSTDL
jgi:MFS family permease